MRITKKQTLSAVIDRVEDGVTAVLLVDDTKAELHVPLQDLPLGSAEGEWLLVELEDDVFVSARLDVEKTEEVRARVRKKRSLLLERMARGRRDRS